MQIQIQKKEGCYQTLSVVIDGVSLCDIHESIFGKRPTFSFECSSQKEWKEQFFLKELSQVKLYVLRRLAMKSYYSGELIQKLKELLVSHQTIEKIIQEYTHLGYINDENWLENFINTCKARKMGPRSITQKMLNKGVPRDVIEQCSEKLCDKVSQQESIRKLLLTRYRNRNLSDFKEKNKVIAGLLRKGFEFKEIQSSLRNIGSGVEDDYIDESYC